MNEEEEEFDGEKTQFWLPGQTPPGHPGAGNATGDAKDGNSPKSPADGQPGSAAKSRTAAAQDSQIDFDLSATEQAGSTGLDFDLSGEAEPKTDTMDFDITGEGTVPPAPEPEPARTAESTPRVVAPKPKRPAAQPEKNGVSGGVLMLAAIIAIAVAVIYFMTQ